MDKYELRRVMEHIEVYDSHGVFQFSTDSLEEAYKELERCAA